ncbi:tetratricopeptide repeat protein [uncultured Ruegeria sp.]|uniref:tetratricopeptide repeat protein n=1 Tax=uncultured Ruegeria sp. TaxID=259304 RepID=UPI00261CF1D6|nr:tetratricopeptide repeat protein [uncultured Ruegeria sp.]
MGDAPAPAKADAPKGPQRRLRVSDLRPRPETASDDPPQDPDYSDGEYDCLMAAAAPGQSPYFDGVKWADMDAENAMAICADLLLKDQDVDAEVVAAFGRSLVKGGRLEMTLEFSELAAMEGSGLAMNTLATLYNDGEIVPEEDETAFAWYMAAAESGLSMGMHIVAYGYENEDGVARDIDKALDYCFQAAEQDDVVALHNLGSLTYHGREGVPQDTQAASVFWGRAAKIGDMKSQRKFGRLLYESGDVAGALKFYRLAAGQGDDVAQQLIRQIEGD